MQHEPDLDALRKKLGLQELPLHLLRQALTHPSVLDEEGAGWESNQRLEFLGDAVLGLVVGEYLYRRLPEATEGRLTSIKSEAVRGKTLAEVARKLELGDYVILGPQERASGGAGKPSILADCVEAILGAIYLSLGLEAASRFVQEHFGDRLEELIHSSDTLDPKSELQQIVQALSQRLPVYTTVSEEGPPHARLFEVEVRFGDTVLGRGRGTSKQRAQQSAAKQALERQEEWLAQVAGQSDPEGDEGE